MRARIYRSDRREFDCKVDETGELVKATALGNLLKQGESLVVGDYVELDKNNETGEYIISKMEKRQNEIYRLLIRENKKKITAANLDYLVIVNSISKPTYKTGILDRFLIRASQWNIKPIVVFNKMDEWKPRKVDLDFEKDRLKNLNIPMIEMASKFDDSYVNRPGAVGSDVLRELLKNKTALFVGQSGVGKSKTIKLLSNDQADLRIKQINKSGKGSHTTTWSEIIEVGEFLLVDSPGIRTFKIDDIPEEDLLPYFPDLCQLMTECQFKNCAHDEKARGCAFYTEDKKNDRALHSRLESYLRISEEIAQVPYWEKSTPDH